MASLYVPPPTLHQVLRDLAQAMADIERVKISVRVDWSDGSYCVSEFDSLPATVASCLRPDGESR
jgi:P2-related tail formation protein